MRRLTLSVALLLVVSACGESRSLAPEARLTVTTSQTSYALGDVIVIRITNTGDQTLVRDACGSLELQQLVGDEWRMQAGQGCALSAESGGATLAPGVVLMDSFPTARALPQGTYRVLYDIFLPNGTPVAEALRASNTFTLK